MPCKPLYCVYGNFVIQQRHYLSLMLLISITVFYSVRLCLNITLTEIAVPLPSKSGSSVHSSCPDDLQADNVNTQGKGEYNWSEPQQGLILASFFYGYLLTHVPGGIVADLYGGKHVLAVGVLTSVVVSCVTPIVIQKLNWICLVGIRVVLGLAQGPLFPAIATLLARWVPVRERSTLGGFVYSGVFMGSVTGNFISGWLIALTEQWPIVFYFWGAVAFVWLIFFVITCYSSPLDHPFVTPEERELLQNEVGHGERLPVPWGKILKDPAVWAFTVLQTGHDWISYTLLTCLPKFYKDVLKFSIAKIGLLTSVSFGLMWVFSIIFGWMSDFSVNHEYTTLGTIRKLYAIISAIGPAGCCVVAAYMECDRIKVVAAIWVGMVLMGPWFPGPKMNVLDLSKNFAGIITSISNGIGVVSGILTPSVIAFLAPDGAPGQWLLVFWIALILSIFSLLVFLIWGSTERAEWDYAAQE